MGTLLDSLACEGHAVSLTLHVAVYLVVVTVALSGDPPFRVGFAGFQPSRDQSA